MDTPHVDHLEPPATSLRAAFGVASAALYLVTFFIFMLERNPAVWGACLAVSLFATANAFGAGLHRCAVAGGVGGGLMVVAVLGGTLGTVSWAWPLLAGVGGSFLLLWAEYRCPQKKLLHFRGRTLPSHPLHQLHPLQHLHQGRA